MNRSLFEDKITYYFNIEFKNEKGDSLMKTEVSRTAVSLPWQVTRHFDGGKDPEALLRALIQAHKL